MINGKTFYQILGVQPDAEDIVIKAAYRALSQRYHPDKWVGDPKVSLERMTELNKAYEVLSDPVLRKHYDDELDLSGKSTEFANDQKQDDEFETYFGEKISEWEYAKQFYPEIETHYTTLKKTSNDLANQYKLMLIETKGYKDHAQIAKRLKQNFLYRYFGSDTAVYGIVEKLISRGRKDVLLEINKAIRMLGPSFVSSDVLPKIAKKFQLKANFDDLPGVNGNSAEYMKIRIKKAHDAATAITVLEELGYQVRGESFGLTGRTFTIFLRGKVIKSGVDSHRLLLWLKTEAQEKFVNEGYN